MDGTESTLADRIPHLSDEAFQDVDIEEGVVDAVASYHDTYHNIVAAQVSDARLAYATEAVMADGSAGPRCGFSVDLSDDDLAVVEIVAHPDDEIDLVDYRVPGIRHRIVLSNDATTWKTAVTAEFEDLREARDALLTHQVAILQIMKETLDAHLGCDPGSLISDVVSSGDLKNRTIHPAGVWEDSNLPGDLLAESRIKQLQLTVRNVPGRWTFSTIQGETDLFQRRRVKTMYSPTWRRLADQILQKVVLRFTIIQVKKGPRAKAVERV